MPDEQKRRLNLAKAARKKDDRDCLVTPNADITIEVSGPGLYPEEANLRDIDKGWSCCCRSGY